MSCLSACASVKGIPQTCKSRLRDHVLLAYVHALSLYHWFLIVRNSMTPCLDGRIIVSPSLRFLAQLAGPHTMCNTCARVQVQLLILEHAGGKCNDHMQQHYMPYILILV